MLPSVFDAMDAAVFLPGKAVHAQLPSLHPVTPTSSAVRETSGLQFKSFEGYSVSPRVSLLVLRVCR